MKPNWRDDRSVEGNLKARLPAMALAFFFAGRKAMKPDRTWNQMHKFRLAAKEFRYTLELFRPVLGAELEVRLAQIERVCSATHSSVTGRYFRATAPIEWIA